MKLYRIKYYLIALWLDIKLGVYDYRIRRKKTKIVFMEVLQNGIYNKAEVNRESFAMYRQRGRY